MGTGDILLGVTLRWTRNPSRGGVAILLGLLHTTETGIRSGRVGLWLVRTFTYASTGDNNVYILVYVNGQGRYSKGN